MPPTATQLADADEIGYVQGLPGDGEVDAARDVVQSAIDDSRDSYLAALETLNDEYRIAEVRMHLEEKKSYQQVAEELYGEIGLKQRWLRDVGASIRRDVCLIAEVLTRPMRPTAEPPTRIGQRRDGDASEWSSGERTADASDGDGVAEYCTAEPGPSSADGDGTRGRADGESEPPPDSDVDAGRRAEPTVTSCRHRSIAVPAIRGPGRRDKYRFAWRCGSPQFRCDVGGRLSVRQRRGADCPAPRR